jgi:hypothetical protein
LLQKILLAAVGVLLVLAGVIAARPSAYSVTRSTTIAAPPDKIFGMINDFHRWEAWSPWAKLDPAMQTSYEGAASGPGAIFRWSGDDQVGEGRMTLLESTPAEAVLIRLEILKPVSNVSTCSFRLEPTASGTTVSWTMAGNNNFFGKAFELFMGGMDKMIGPDFEKGLTQMKAAAEAVPTR